MGPDKFLHERNLARFQLAFTRDRWNWTNFWTAKCTSLAPSFSGPKLAHLAVQVLFCVFMDQDEVEVHTCKLAKKERGQYPAIWTSHLVNKGFIIWLSGKFFLQDIVGTCSRVANISERFCPSLMCGTRWALLRPVRKRRKGRQRQF